MKCQELYPKSRQGCQAFGIGNINKIAAEMHTLRKTFSTDYFWITEVAVQTKAFQICSRVSLCYTCRAS